MWITAILLTLWLAAAAHAGPLEDCAQAQDIDRRILGCSDRIRQFPRRRYGLVQPRLRLSGQGRFRPRHRRQHQGYRDRSGVCHGLLPPRHRLREERAVRSGHHRPQQGGRDQSQGWAGPSTPARASTSRPTSARLPCAMPSVRWPSIRSTRRSGTRAPASTRLWAVLRRPSQISGACCPATLRRNRRSMAWGASAPHRRRLQTLSARPSAARHRTTMQRSRAIRRRTSSASGRSMRIARVSMRAIRAGRVRRLALAPEDADALSAPSDRCLRMPSTLDVRDCQGLRICRVSRA